MYEEERQTDKGEVKRLKVERNEMEKDKQNDVVSFSGLGKLKYLNILALLTILRLILSYRSY